ncbi:hypothetical protein CLOP_g5468 [Closterium sp. NIES-67]|nr:hypothetical protein CLOP_g5468 [Closterium sp. NIES-67]
MSNGVRASKPLVSAASAAARAAAARTATAAADGRRGASSLISGVFAPPAEASHLFGIPRRVAIATISSLSWFYMNVLNRMEVTNRQTLLDLVHSRPADTPLITVSNHMATIDDPLLWGGVPGLRIWDPKLCRWTLTASEICFRGVLDSYIFRIGKSIPISRNLGVFQQGMDEALLRLHQGDWLHIFPEARIIQEHGPLPRLKWGLASLLDRLCPSLPPPILLCVGHSGLERIIPQNYRGSNKRPLIPLWNQRVSVVVGEPFSFDIPSLRQQAKDAARLDALSSDHSSSSRTDSSSSSSSSSTSSSNRSDSSTSSSSSTSMRDSDAAVSLDPTWRQQLLTFGTDALIHSPEVLTQRLQDLTQRGLLAESAGGGGRTGDGERLEGGVGGAESGERELSVEGREEEAEALRRRIENVRAVGNEETRRMYAHMMDEVRRRLEAVVFEAHDRQQRMK